MEQFKPKGVSVFNTFFADDLQNAFVNGILALVLHIELTNIVNLLLYNSPTLNKSSLDRCIIYSRLPKPFKFLNMLKGLEWPKEIITTSPPALVSDKDSSNDVATKTQGTHHALSVLKRVFLHFWSNNDVFEIPRISINYSKLLVPCLLFSFLFSFQMVAIYLIDSHLEVVMAGPGFDSRLDLRRQNVSSQRKENGCDNFIVNPRGGEKTGKLLKCVRRSRGRHFTTSSGTNISITGIFKKRINAYYYEIEGKEAFNIKVTVKNTLNLIGGQELQIAPLRPDVDQDHASSIFVTVVNRTLTDLGHFMTSETSVSQSIETGEVRWTFSQPISVQTEDLATSLVGQLRSLSLATNLSSLPWVFVGEGKYAEMSDAKIAIIVKNRIANGWLTTIALLTILFRFLIYGYGRSLTLDEAAFLAAKYIIKTDVTLGPTARKNETKPVALSKFSDGYTGHIGFCRMNSGQEEVLNFWGCREVLGSSLPCKGVYTIEPACKSVVKDAQGEE